MHKVIDALTGLQEVAEEEELDKSQWGELESESESEEESDEEDEEKDESGLVTPAEGSVLCFCGRFGGSGEVGGWRDVSGVCAYSMCVCVCVFVYVVCRTWRWGCMKTCFKVQRK